jgi:hypothetical protein
MNPSGTRKSEGVLNENDGTPSSIEFVAWEMVIQSHSPLDAFSNLIRYLSNSFQR